MSNWLLIKCGPYTSQHHSNTLVPFFSRIESTVSPGGQATYVEIVPLNGNVVSNLLPLDSPCCRWTARQSEAQAEVSAWGPGIVI